MADGKRNEKILILGGTGFIGRNLVQYLITDDLVHTVRVADKVPPAMAWLNARHKEAFLHSKVEFKHLNLISPSAVSTAFTCPDGEFDFVINLAAETKYGQTEAVYKDGIVILSQNCAKEAARRGVRRYIELSSARMHSSDRKAFTEDMNLEPWTSRAMHKHVVEESLKNMTDLDYIIVRPSITYGLGDKLGLTPRLIIGAIYKYIGEKMKVLWNKDLKMNTIHITDLCRAIWHLCHHGKRGESYHISDKGNTSQGKVMELVSEIFNINYDYFGSAMSNLARLDIENLVAEINDKHMVPWADACQKDGILNTPLNPFIDQELLLNKHLFIDGSKIEQTGFSYLHPELEIHCLKEVLDDYLRMELFPPSLLSRETLWQRRTIDEDDGDI